MDPVLSPNSITFIQGTEVTPVQPSAHELDRLLRCLCFAGWDEFLAVRKDLVESFAREVVTDRALALLADDDRHSFLICLLDPAFLADWNELPGSVLIGLLKTIVLSSRVRDVQIGALGAALQEIRRNELGLADPGGSFKARLSAAETSMLDFLFAISCKDTRLRSLIFDFIMLNIDGHCGHLPVNRARQALRMMARQAGTRELLKELDSDREDIKCMAVVLLGRVKNPNVVHNLLNIYASGSGRLKELAADALKHYSIFDPAGLV
ncbi:MAG: hypothetical protein AB7W16_04925 [Candidatus Obscuribacterales bacterium]